AFYTNHWGKEKADSHYDKLPGEFDYGPLNKLGFYKGTHPAVMKDMISRHDWKHKLQYRGEPDKNRAPHKHEQPRVKFLTWIEQNLNRGKQIATFHNYELIKNI
ncbi:MAG: hypothetical protein ACOC2K_04620, partial [Bacteroidota bacterium]